MSITFEENKQLIINHLNSKISTFECPICHQKEMVLADGFFNNLIQNDLSGSFIIGGPTIPTVPVICKNCGFLMQFAAGVLGLLKDESQPSNSIQERTEKNNENKDDTTK